MAHLTATTKDNVTGQLFVDETRIKVLIDTEDKMSISFSVVKNESTRGYEAMFSVIETVVTNNRVSGVSHAQETLQVSASNINEAFLKAFDLFQSTIAKWTQPQEIEEAQDSMSLQAQAQYMNRNLKTNLYNHDVYYVQRATRYTDKCVMVMSAEETEQTVIPFEDFDASEVQNATKLSKKEYMQESDARYTYHMAIRRFVDYYTPDFS